MELRLSATPEIVKLVAGLDHIRGGWTADQNLPAERLHHLAAEVRMRSVAAAARMAGLRLADAQVREILDSPFEPGWIQPAEAAPVRAYARTLTARFPASGLVSTEEIRRLHGLAIGASEPSPWREGPLHHEEFVDGKATGRILHTLPPRVLPDRMEDLVTWLEIELREAHHHPLLVIGGFVLAFLAASPFELANGRTARAMAVGLLRRAGYAHVDYASLDVVVEESRTGWFDGLGASATQLWVGGANTDPWLAYFLDLLRRQADRAVEAISMERSVLEFTRLQRSILDAVREHGTVGAGLLMSCTGANRNTLKDNLRRLVEKGMLERTGSRRGTRYRLAGAPMAAAEPTLH
ncbi:MAG TPA: Fic family protein [Candidatus Polarisedimenticolaceae bacterium]|nr:Fic family protein [Candidatus Polarisedimenticolaceae bacterium]